MEQFEDLRRRLFGKLKHEFSAYRGVRQNVVAKTPDAK